MTGGDSEVRARFVAACIGTRTSAARVGRYGSLARALLIVTAICGAAPLLATSGIAPIPVARAEATQLTPASTPQRPAIILLTTEADDDDDSDDVGLRTPRHLAADDVLFDAGALASLWARKAEEPTGPLLAELAVTYPPDVRPPIRDGIAA
jgi:hypothetical protein